MAFAATQTICPLPLVAVKVVVKEPSALVVPGAPVDGEVVETQMLFGGVTKPHTIYVMGLEDIMSDWEEV